MGWHLLLLLARARVALVIVDCPCAGPCAALAQAAPRVGASLTGEPVGGPGARADLSLPRTAGTVAAVRAEGIRGGRAGPGLVLSRATHSTLFAPVRNVACHHNKWTPRVRPWAWGTILLRGSNPISPYPTAARTQDAPNTPVTHVAL